MGNTSPYRVLRSVLSASNRSKKMRPVKEDGFKFFNQLPAVLKGAISAPLAAKDAANLSCSSKEINALLQHPPAVPMTVRQFLLHVVRGEHAAMQNMLRGNINLLCQRGIVTDCSGREFGSISGFEYALWALDKFQWDDMLACLPRDNTGQLTEEGQKIVSQLQEHYAHVKTNGVRYRLNEETKTEAHYDFALINALQEQVDAQMASGEKNWAEINKQWREGVGSAQRLCPMHVVDEYCSNTPFYPVPQFDFRPRPANSLRQFYNYLSSAWASWFTAESKLGLDFGIYKGLGGEERVLCRSAYFHGGETVASWMICSFDLDAVSALCKTRTLDFSELEARLESMMDIEARPYASF